MNPDDVPAGPLVVDTDVFSWLAWRRERHEEFGALVEGHVLAVSFRLRLRASCTPGPSMPAGAIAESPSSRRSSAATSSCRRPVL